MQLHKTSIKILKEQTCTALRTAGIVTEEAHRETELILEHCLNLDPMQQLIHENDPVDSSRQLHIEKICKQRLSKVPLQYCLGHANFWGMKLAVRAGVFIPRSDSETLVEVALLTLRNKSPLLIADIGTGSGALAIAVATELPHSRIIAIDISNEALELARQNAEAFRVAHRIEFLKGHWKKVAPKGLDAIISNPPYINRLDRAVLPPEIVQYEPHEAIFGAGHKGLGLYQELAQTGNQCLKAGGWAVLELGDRQAEATVKIFADAGWKEITQHNDLNGLPRVLTARLP